MRFLKHTSWSLLAVVIGMIANDPASAAGFGGALQPGSTVCTDWLRTDGGNIYLRGYAAGTGVYTWTMLMSDTVGGPETEILRATGWDVTRLITPPVAGRHYYRNCLDVAGKQAAGYRLLVTPGAGALNPLYGVGAHTAKLTPGSSACGEFAMSTVIFKGTSDRHVQWSIRGTDMDYSGVGDIFSFSGTSVDQIINLPSWIFSIDACATHTTTGIATLQFDLLEP